MTEVQILSIGMLLLAGCTAILLAMVIHTRAMLPHSPPTEHYIRTSISSYGVTIEPGIEWRRGDDEMAIQTALESIAKVIAHRASYMPTMEAAKSVEGWFLQVWPGRAWFVEVHDDVHERWTQSYQPSGLPRNRESPALFAGLTQAVRGLLRKSASKLGMQVAITAPYAVNGYQHGVDARYRMGDTAQDGRR